METETTHAQTSNVHTYLRTQSLRNPSASSPEESGPAAYSEGHHFAMVGSVGKDLNNVIGILLMLSEDNGGTSPRSPHGSYAYGHSVTRQTVSSID
jgi:hypothetical protein